MTENRKVILSNVIGIVQCFLFFFSTLSIITAFIIGKYLGAIFWVALALLLYKPAKDFVTERH